MERRRRLRQDVRDKGFPGAVAGRISTHSREPGSLIDLDRP